jgi:hypothetical protein
MGRHVPWLYEAKRTTAVDDHILRRRIEITRKKASASLALKTAQKPGAVVDKVSEPILDVRRIGARLEES